ncbi:MAG: Fe-Mn family superoxide dismutase [Candidatus Zambryskibacteria bacterium]|nr:Fe-Mn family superoxide dismutase [Candidatus Zambryskibacteria bacterium]
MAKQFEEKKFNIPKLKGLSTKSIEEHLKLYAGYVKNANLILAKIDEYSEDSSPLVGAGEEHAYALGEIQRRLGFEFDGMRNHEYYFAHLEKGQSNLKKGSDLKKAIEEEWGTFERWLSRFKTLATTRGVGWAMLYYDKENEKLINTWVDEQHLGHLTGLSPILTLDMWEHSYVVDYQPSGKKQYIEDFFENLNWNSCEENFSSASRK